MGGKRRIERKEENKLQTSLIVLTRDIFQCQLTVKYLLGRSSAEGCLFLWCLCLRPLGDSSDSLPYSRKFSNRANFHVLYEASSYENKMYKNFMVLNVPAFPAFRQPPRPQQTPVCNASLNLAAIMRLQEVRCAEVSKVCVM